MAEIEYPRLCGGTFFTLLLQAKKGTATHRQRTEGVSDVIHDQDMLFVLYLMYNPDYIRPEGETLKTYASMFKNCSGNLPSMFAFDNETLTKAMTDEYPKTLRKMTGFVHDYLAVGTKAAQDMTLVKRLIELIRDDGTIGGKTVFIAKGDGIGITKDELPSVTEVFLPAFLLSVYLFIVRERKDNSVGRVTVKAWFPHVQNRYQGLSGKSIPQIITVNPGERPPVEPEGEQPDNEALLSIEPAQKPKPDPDLEYLAKLRSRHTTAKTLISGNQPCDLYDFYVPNSLETGNASWHKLIENPIAADVCGREHFVIISGKGGAGKSMMMQHLLLSTADCYPFIEKSPVFARLDEYRDIDTDMGAFLYSKAADADKAFSAERFTTSLENGDLLFLLDGMDEIPSALQLRFARDLQRFADAYPQNHYVVSSRPGQAFGALFRFAEWRIQPFTLQQAVRMIENLDFRPDAPEIKKGFLLRLEEEACGRHSEFTGNPLLLTMMLLVYERGGKMPEQSYRFYEAAFDALAERHDANKGYERRFRSGLGKEQFRDILAEICFRSYADGKYELTAAEFEGYYRHMQTAAATAPFADLASDLCDNLCLMNQEGGIYRFVHRSFQEYFAALFLQNSMINCSPENRGALSDYLIDVFEHLHTNETTVLELLQEMTPQNTESYIIIPYLERLFADCEKPGADRTAVFFEKLFPSLRLWYAYNECIEYDGETGEKVDESYYDFAIDSSGWPRLLHYIARKLMGDAFYEETESDEWPYDIDEVIEKIPLIIAEPERTESEEHDTFTLVKDDPTSTASADICFYSDFERVTHSNTHTDGYHFNAAHIRAKPDRYPTLIWVLEHDAFPYRKLAGKLYPLVRNYLQSMKAAERPQQGPLPAFWAADYKGGTQNV